MTGHHDPGRVLHPAVLPLDGLTNLERPLVIAGFSGAGGRTAGAAVSALIEQWDARPIAELDPDEFYDFTVARPLVRVEGGERAIDWPYVRIYAARPAGLDRDVVLISGIEPHLRWRTFAAAIADVLAMVDAQEVILLSAFGGATPHTRALPIRLSGGTPALAGRLGLPSRAPRYQGPATFTMALATLLAERELHPATLTAIAPFYVGLDPAPHAIRALLDALAPVACAVSHGILDEQIAEVDARAAQAMERQPDLATLVGNLEQQYDESTDAADVAPHSGEHSARDTAPASTLSTDEVLRDVEALLQRRPDSRGSGYSPRAV